MSERYEGKPFLRLLDSYVLDAIGHLDPAADAALVAMEPKFHEVCATSGDWRTVVAQQMQFPAGMAGAIRELWDKGHDKFVAANGHDPDPAEFTRVFVDSNFPR